MQSACDSAYTPKDDDLLLLDTVSIFERGCDWFDTVSIFFYTVLIFERGCNAWEAESCTVVHVRGGILCVRMHQCLCIYMPMPVHIRAYACMCL